MNADGAQGAAGLEMPGELSWRPAAWQQIVSKDRAFCCLREAAQAKQAEQALANIEAWEDRIAFLEGELCGQPVRNQWDKIHALGLCAVQAQEQRTGPIADGCLDSVVGALGEQPCNMFYRDPGWVAVCVRLLRGDLPRHTVRVPVALARSESGKDPAGSIVHLVLEILPGGGGRIGHHPADLMGTITTFHTPVAQAWEAARALTMDRQETSDGCWGLEDGESESIPSVDGASAGGAAVRGWWYLLSGKKPDPGVLVLARLQTGNTGLDGVDEITAKVGAAVKDRSIDTIVVCSSNAAEARKALKKYDSEGKSLIDIVEV